MPEHIITPKQSWSERLWQEVKSFSPQVKAALIGAAVALLLAIAGYVGVSSENSSLKAKVHDLEMEVLPFRNLAVQQFNKADTESLKKLAESMATLHRDYSTQLATINDLRKQIEQLKQGLEDRSLTSEQEASLLHELTSAVSLGKAANPIVIASRMADRESLAYGRLIKALVDKSGWQNGFTELSTHSFQGLTIFSNPSTEDSRAYLIVRDAFKKSGIPFSDQALDVRRTPIQHEHAVYIIIGYK